AASAITGGKPIKTMWLTWRYTLSAFLVPFIFVLSDDGVGLLLQGGPGTVALAFVVSLLAVASLAVATGAWLLGPAGWPERILLGVGSLPMLVMEPLYIGIGAAIIAAGVLVHILGLRKHRTDMAPGRKDNTSL
ncbi:MAG TPA: C4-dicarboxylate ABC transporter permease, partial [Arthrobacter sp.]